MAAISDGPANGREQQPSPAICSSMVSTRLFRRAGRINVQNSPSAGEFAHQSSDLDVSNIPMMTYDLLHRLRFSTAPPQRTKLEERSMICFETYINGKKVCLAGVGTAGVLNAILSWVNRERHEADEVRDPQATRFEELIFSVGGMTDHGNDSVYQDWWRKAVNVGDEIRLRIVEQERCDPPIDTRTDTADFIEKSKRAYYEQLKQEYEGEKDGNQA